MRRVIDTPDAPTIDGGALSFDGFRLDLDNRALSLDGRRVHIRPREIDLLIYLAQRPNRFISNDELARGVWGGQPMSDANLRVQVSALRRILAKAEGGQSVIDGLHQRGYRLRLPDPCVVQPAAPAASHTLPVRIKRFFGREYDAARLVGLLAQNRLATIVGPGGIGKTALALAAAEGLAGTFADGVRFVDLAGLSDGALVAGTLAATVGAALGPDAAEDALVKALAPRHILFVVDNCEHLIASAAALVESLLTQTRHIRFLCTSREPLRVDGESLLRLAGLDLPPQDDGLAPERIATYAAVQLFNDRANQGGDGFHPDDRQMVAVAGLCRRLDGNPLAIELAAARLSLFGLDGLAAQLEESFGLLVQGRRTAVPRHKTLRATIDWSYRLLPPAERRLLDRLSVFRGAFSLDAARTVAGDGLDEPDLVHCLAELVAKSLVNVDSVQPVPHYRLLLLTREFGLEQLTQAGDHDRVALRHAEYFLDLMTLADCDRHADAEAWVPDTQAAIDWSLGVPGHPELACKLLRASFNVMERFSRLADRGRMIERALKRVGDAPETDTFWKLSLYIQRFYNLQFTSDDEARLVAWAAQTDRLAERVWQRSGDPMVRLEVLASRCGVAFSFCDAPRLVALATEGEAQARVADPTGPRRLRFERSLFQAHHFNGDHDTAARYLAGVLAYPEETLNRRTMVASDYISPAVTARLFKARILWLQGDAASASEIAAEALAMADRYAPNVTCYVLGFAAIPVALWRGDDATARTGIQQIDSIATEAGLGYWTSWGRLYDFVLGTRLEDAPIAVPPALVKNAFHTDHLATLCLSDNPRALARVETGRVGWNAPEVLRHQAEWLVASRTGAEAEAWARRALDLAQQQKAPAWELRAAVSLARLGHAQAQARPALDILRAVLDRFGRSPPDRDVVAARTLVSELELA